jgi:predicted nucleic acid-binding protein
MMIFVDTSALLAVSFSGDNFAEAAQKVWADLLAREDELVCNNYTILETISLLQRRFGLEVVKFFLDNIAPALHIVWVDESQHEAALSAVLAANRRELSLVDCISFETMRRLGIRRAFAFDPHFTELGFESPAG